MGNDNSRENAIVIKHTLYFYRFKKTNNITIMKHGDKKGDFVNKCYANIYKDNGSCISHSLCVIGDQKSVQEFDAPRKDHINTLRKYLGEYYNAHIKNKCDTTDDLQIEGYQKKYNIVKN